MDSENQTPGTTPDTSTGIQQLHHRACVSCARAKVKCVPGKDSIACERCSRLKRLCEPVLGPKRKPHKHNRITKHHVEKLEEKLDDLVTLLKSSKEPALSVKVHQPNPASAASSVEPPGLEQQDVFRPAHTPRVTPVYSSGHSTGTPQSVAQACDFRGDAPASDKLQPSNLKSFTDGSCAGDELLEQFREHMCVFFPFVIIPETVTAKELQEQRPYFYNALLAVSNRDPTLQKALGKGVMRDLAERFVVNGERSLDLLLGVLTYAGWCYYHFYAVVNLTTLLSAAHTIVCDLGLHRLKEYPGSIIKEAFRKSSTYQALVNKERTLEERRALLGCFFLMSATSVLFHRMEPMKLSPYVEECCTVLAASNDHPMDRIAVSLVRLQILVERLRQSSWHGNHDPPTTTIPPMLYIRSVEKQLEELKKDWPPEIEQSGVLLMKYYSLQIYIYEIGLTQTSDMTSFPSYNFQRLELLHNCLQAIKNYFNEFFSMAFTNFHWFSVPVYTQASNAITTFERLSNFHHPDWDLAYVRETLDFFGVLDKFIELFDFCRKQYDADESNLFHLNWKKARAVKAYCESKMLSIPRPEPTDENDGDLTMASSMNFDFLSEPWLLDGWGPLDYHINFGDSFGR
ncbi:hypothetical protein F5884DRAFT_755216 [Xylogone sp. PMI_703]|nr:hypothetical protein F5884DRAFT_755216 [Xylogone sp. PMI_703]